MNFSCFVIGEGPLACACVELLVSCGCRVRGVVSPDPELCALAEEKRLPVYTGDVRLEQVFYAHAFDYLFSIVWRDKLSAEVLSLPRQMAINYHDALLPAYAGTRATVWALLNRERQHGVSWHLMTEQVDAGDTLQQLVVEVDAGETTQSLDLKCLEAGLRSFRRLIDDLDSGRVERTPQLLQNRTFYPLGRLPPNGAVLDWRRPADELDALCRALDFGPHRKNTLALPRVVVGGDVFIIETRGTGPVSNEDPGTVLSPGGGSLVVATGAGSLAVDIVSDIDGQPVQTNDVVARYGLTAGCVLPDTTSFSSDRVSRLLAGMAQAEPYWVQCLARLAPLEIPYPLTRRSSGPVTGPRERLEFDAPDMPGYLVETGNGPVSGQQSLAAAFVVYLARLAGSRHFHVWFGHESLPGADGKTPRLCMPAVPLEIQADRESRAGDLLAHVLLAMQQARQRGTLAREVFARYPEYRLPASAMGIQVDVPGEQATPAAAWPVFLQFSAAGKGGAFELLYAPTVVDETLVRSIGNGFLAFLEGMLALPDTPVGKVSLLSIQDRQRVLEQWNDTEDQSVPDACVHRLIEQQVECGPERVAAVCQGQRLSYRELNGKANVLALELARHGAGKGDYVPVLMNKGLDLLVSYLAIMKAGAAFVPVDLAWPEGRRAGVIDSLGTAVVLVDSSFVGGTAGESPRHLKVDYRSLAIVDENPDRLSDAGAPAYVIFTSGSTGKPKGVINTHRGTVNRFFGCGLDYRRNGHSLQDMRVLNSSAPVFDPSVRQLLWPLTEGGRTVIPLHQARPDPADFLDLVAREQVTSAGAVSSFFNVVTETLETRPGAVGQLASLVHFLVGGEPLDVDTAYRFKSLCPHVALYDAYGPSETAMAVTAFEVKGEKPDVLPIGKPYPNVTAYIVNEDLEPVPVGAIGELCIGGLQVGHGYLNDTEATRTAFVDNPFSRSAGEKLYRTGDFAYYRPDGNIVFTGRKDEQVKVRGVRIELEEIRTALDAHPDVRESVVITSDEAGDEPVLVAYVVPASKAGSLVDRLKTYLSTLLPAASVPSVFMVLEYLPRLVSGKLDRRNLPRPQRAARQPEGRECPPQSALELDLAGIWCEVLGLESLEATAELFTYGADSISMMRIINRIQQQFDVMFTFRDAFECATISDVAARIEHLGYPHES